MNRSHQLPAPSLKKEAGRMDQATLRPHTRRWALSKLLINDILSPPISSPFLFKVERPLSQVHELSAATSILRTILPAAEEKGATEIKSVKLEIGELTLLNPDQLRFCFQIAAKDTIAQGADLVIENRPAVVACQNCGKRFSWHNVDDDPALHLIPPMIECDCGSASIKILSGREMKVVSIKIERLEGN